nr:protein transport protein Sec24C [Bactrocera oleae]
MNPNMYGAPPQQPQYTPGWPPATQQPMPPSGAPPQMGPPGASYPPNSMPPTSAASTPAGPLGALPPQQNYGQGQQPGLLNGNYQQQLTNSMSGLSMNATKQPTPVPPQTNTPYANANIASAAFATPNPQAGAPDAPPLSNGPPTNVQSQQQPQVSNANNNFISGPYTNGQPAKQPQTQPPQAPTSMYPPAPNTSTPPMQSVPGGPNQMNVNSANLPGLPHMPPKPSGIVPLPGQPPVAATPPTSITGGMPQYQQPGAQQMPPRPGQIPHQAMSQPLGPPAQQQQQTMLPGQPGMPPISTAAALPPQPGMPPMPGYPPQPQQQAYPPQTQMPQRQQQQQQPGFPPQPQHTVYPSQAGQPGYPPQQPGYPPQQPLQTGYPGQMMPPTQAGQPPMPGRPGYNQPPAPGGMYQQPQRRLDPDQMPNPISVIIENQRNAGGAFVTNQPGLLPPLVTTKYVVQDQGNSSPRYVRSSLYCIPATADLLKTTALPLTLLVSPMARTIEGEYEPQIVNFGELGPIRCNRCKAYMSPNMQFVDAGRRFQCLMCKVTTEVPTEYFQHLDHTGQRVDKYERAELVLGTYEFLATKDYCRNNTPPEIPAFIFVIDVSYNTIKSGLVHLLCSQIKQVLQHLPVDQGQDKSKMRVGFITYNSTVHFYNIKSSLAQPQMMVVGDVQDMFMPLLDGFLCHPEESEALIDALMEQIPKMFVDTKETETVFYPAIQAGLEALKASNCAGKLLVFNSTLPIAEGRGKLKNRDDRKLLGTEKEKTVLTPQCLSYNTLGQDCVQNGVSVDLFLFNNSYIDIATLGQVARLSGGEVYKYTYFQADLDGNRLIADIIKNVSRPIAFDAVMRVRTSAGIRPTDFYGHFYMTNTTDVELASIDCNKSVAIEIKHDDKLPPEENIYIQIALLYTSVSGQRRLRVLNLALRATTTIADVFKCCDLDAIMLFFAKQACSKLLEHTPKQVKDNLINRSAQILACYRKHCTSPTSAGQLILPECLKLLPLYVSCLLKNDAISGGSDMTLDDRSYVMQFVQTMDLNMSVSYLYPRFIPIHNIDIDDNELPMSIRCTHEKMSEDGAYILENGVHLFVWLGQSLPQTFIQPLFGVQCTQQVNAERFAITGETPLAQRVRNIIDTIMKERTRNMRVTCVRQNDKLESVFRHFLIEDRGTDGSPSYVDFLCHMHKEIKDLLS